MRKIFALCLFIAVFILSANVAYARTLQGGRAYSFVNSDVRQGVFVSVTGTASYEYVMKDSAGIVVGYGLGMGRFQVVAGGETIVFATGNRTVSYPSGRLAVQALDTDVQQVPILSRITVSTGQSVVLQNNHFAETRRVMVDISDGIRRYDLIVNDRHGQSVQVAENLAFSNINIPADGSATIHAADPEGLTLIFPAIWDELTFHTGMAGPAVIPHIVNPGETITITNRSQEAEFNVTSGVSARPGAGAAESIINYTYQRGPFDETIVRTEVVFHEKTIEPGFTWTVSVLRGGAMQLLIPQEWIFMGLEITGVDSPAVSGYEVLAGQSLLVANSDPEAMYNIIIESIVPGTEFQYNYVWETVFDIGYGIDSEYSVRTLLPESVFIISPAQGSRIRVVIPTAWESVTAEIITEQAVYVRDVASEGSIQIDNINTGEFRHITWRNRLETGVGLLDYIAWDHENRIDDFGIAEADRQWELGPGEGVALTNREQTPLMVYFPYSWLGVDIEVAELADPVLARQTVRPGDVIEIHSRDSRFDWHVAVEHGSLPTNDIPEYHFVVRGFRDIADFGVSTNRIIPLVGRGTTIIAPARGVAITVVVPAQWTGRMLNIEEGTVQPLHRTVLRPGGRLRLDNRMNAEAVVQVVGRYFLRRDGDESRIGSREEPIEGDVRIQGRESVMIVAAQGADVEIWMPTEWRSRLLG